MENEYGLDTSYFKSKMERILRDIDRYTPDEFAREMARMAAAADKSVLSEPEFLSATVATHMKRIECAGVGDNNGFFEFSPEQFKREFLCVFTPNQRDVDLDKRLEQYYRETPDSMSNKDARVCWKQFKQWAAEHGYTQENINRAKRRVSSRNFD